MVAIPEAISNIIPNTQALLTTIKYGFWFGSGALLIVAIYLWWNNKRIFTFPVVVFRRRGDKRKIRRCKGGYIVKDKLRTFRFKWGRNILNNFISMKRSRKDLDYLPDTNLMDEEGTIYFDQYDPDTYVQVRKFHMKKPTRLRKIKFLQPYGNFSPGEEIKQYEHIVSPLVENEIAEYSDSDNKEYFDTEEIHFEPVPRDTKALAVQSIKGVADALGKDAFKTTLMIGGLIVLGVTLIVTIFVLSS